MKNRSRDKKSQDRQVREAYEDMLVRIAIAAEYKDPGAGGHIRRVSDYSTTIARAMSVPEDEIQILRYASMMHDIGKMGIRDVILEKPTSLTPEERKKIEGHTIMGGRMFEGSTSPIVMASAQIALTHHEKYDGTGYPKGLRGEDIPLYGRIVSVADYFDAFVSERNYKKAWSFNDALIDINSKAGTSFDPKVVAAFMSVKEKIKQILEANKTITRFIKDDKN